MTDNDSTPEIGYQPQMWNTSTYTHKNCKNCECGAIFPLEDCYVSIHKNPHRGAVARHWKANVCWKQCKSCQEPWPDAERQTSAGSSAKAVSTLRVSQAVSHPSTIRAFHCFTLEFRRDPVLSVQYGRQLKMHRVWLCRWRNATRSKSLAGALWPSAMKHIQNPKVICHRTSTNTSSDTRNAWMSGRATWYPCLMMSFNCAYHKPRSQWHATTAVACHNRSGRR